MKRYFCLGEFVISDLALINFSPIRCARFWSYKSLFVNVAVEHCRTLLFRYYEIQI
jgi:hypothetical protein